MQRVLTQMLVALIAEAKRIKQSSRKRTDYAGAITRSMIRLAC